MALYLPADRPTNIRLADALIFSCGGSRIELGEGERLLADPYFPKHQPLTPELRTTLRRYYDFAVRYGEWLGPAAPSPLPTGTLRGRFGDLRATRQRFVLMRPTGSGPCVGPPAIGSSCAWST